MIPSRKLNRRSFLAAVIGGGALAGGATALVIGREGGSIAFGNGVTDSDTGQVADIPANGRGTPRGYTDSDVAPVRDAHAAGRGPGARTQGAAARTGNGHDPAAASVRGQASAGCSDADIGAVADAGGSGRACANRRS